MWEDTEAWINIAWISAIVIVIIVGLRLGAEAMGFEPGWKPPVNEDDDRDSEPSPE